jgi:hypothetical protein
MNSLKEEEIKSWCNDFVIYPHLCPKIKTKADQNDIHNLIKNHIFPKNVNSSSVLTFLGLFNKYYKYKTDNVEVFFKRAIKNKNVNAMFYQGLMFIEDENFLDAEKYLNKAKERIDITKEIHNQGVVYDEDNCLDSIEKMKFCYNLAIKWGYPNSMFNLSIYYKKREMNELKMIELLKLAAENDYERATTYLAEYYREKEEYEKGEYYLIKSSEILNVSQKEINNRAIIAFNKFLHYHFNIQAALNGRKYLDERNRVKLNKKLYIYNQFKNINIQFETVDCHICYENEMKAVYNCNCKRVTICINCYKKFKKCPYCKSF